MIFPDSVNAIAQHPWVELAWKWVTTTHYDFMPWVGWVMAGLVLILGPLWLWKTMRRAVRALYQSFRRLRNRRTMLQEALRHHSMTQEMFENCATPGLIADLPSGQQIKH